MPSASSSSASFDLERLVPKVAGVTPHRFTATVSALPLFSLMVSLGFEVRLGERLSVQGLLGAGVPGGKVGFNAGAQARYVLAGAVEAGLFAGAELSHLQVASSGFTWLAALVGYKYALAIGLMAEAEVGVEGIYTTGPLAGAYTPVAPFLKLALGYAFGDVAPAAGPGGPVSTPAPPIPMGGTP
jgi:hypothetical protein